MSTEQARQVAQALERPFCDLDITGQPASAALLGAYHSMQIEAPGVPLLAAPRPAAVVLEQIADGCPDGDAEPAPPKRQTLVRGLAGYRPGDPGWEEAVEATVRICMGIAKEQTRCPEDETRCRDAVEKKLCWLSGLAGAGSPVGPVVFLSDPDDHAPRAFVELIPLSCAHVPVPFAGPHDLLLTCVHAAPDPAGDPRVDLLRKAAASLLDPGAAAGPRATGIWAVSGRSRPYPNGPLPVLQQAGFREVAGLGRVWLPDRGYDEMVLVHRPAEDGKGDRKAVGILVHPGDNVVTLPNGGTSGDRIVAHGLERPLRLHADVPGGHKAATRDIARGDQVIKYGESIGIATAPIGAGEHVHVHNVAGSRAGGNRPASGGDHE